jgi:hypothetical protein
VTKSEAHRLALLTLDPTRRPGGCTPNNAFEFWQALGGPGEFRDWQPPLAVQRFIDAAFPASQTEHESIPAPEGSPPSEPFQKAERFEDRSNAAARTIL